MRHLGQILDRVDTHGTAASELFLVLFAIRGVALAVRTVCGFAARARGSHIAAA